MSVLSTVELLCYFESLRNVDLFEQGFYSVRSKIYAEKTNTAAIPLTHYNTSSPARKIDNPRHKLFPAQISPERNAYSTKTFWVQYTEEVIDINEAVHFRIDAPDLDSQNLLLEVELLFSPEESTKNLDQLKPISQQKFRMKALQQGMNQFYPIIFDEWHFAVVRFSVHACLLDFTYKPSIASFLRFPSFSSSPYTDEQDRMDVSLFGVPCRKLLQESYAKLARNFQKLCVHVHSKQRDTLGSDYFVTPPLSIVPSLSLPSAASKSSSAPNSPTLSKRPQLLSPKSPLSKQRSFSLFSQQPPNTTHSQPSSPTAFSTKQRSFSLFSQQPPSIADTPLAILQNNANTNKDTTNNSYTNTSTPSTATNGLTTSNDDEYDSDYESSSDDSDDITTTDSHSTSVATSASTSLRSSASIMSNPSTTPTPEDPQQVNPLKLMLLLNNVRDQHGIGSPRTPTSPTTATSPANHSPKATIATLSVRDQYGIGSPRTPTGTPPSTSLLDPKVANSPATISDNTHSQNGILPRPPSIPPPTGAPPPVNLSDPKAVTAAIAGSLPATPRQSPSSSAGSTPRLSASTGLRPSPRDCATATLGRPPSNTPPSLSPPPSPSLSPLVSPALSPIVSPTLSPIVSPTLSPIVSPALSPPPSPQIKSRTEPPPLDFSPPPSPLRSKGHSVPSMPSITEEIRKARKARRRSITFTTRPLLGPAPQEVRAKEIMNQLHFIGDQIFALWIRFTKVFHLVGKENTFRIAQKYELKYLKLFRDSVFREVAHVSSLGQMLELQADPQKHRQMVQSVRNSEYYKKLKACRFELVVIRPELTGQPIILEQLIDTSRYSTPEEIVQLDDGPSFPSPNSPRAHILPPIPSSSSSPPARTPPLRKLVKQHSFVNNPPKAFSGSHLYIMVHGLAGNPWDLRMFRNQIALNFPESEFLICSCVEQNTLGDIEEMGNNVAKEICEYLQSSTLQIGKISFVGHSLGGVIIRAALCDPLLAPYVDKFYTFVSLSVPHVGTLFPYSSLIPGAMWVWQKWSNSACLLQLRLMDHPDPTKTYLYKLSQKKGLEYFQNILLVSSEQDLYVPFHSARIELCREADKTSASQPLSGPLLGMVQGVWGSVLEGWKARGRFGEIVRYDVVFESHRGMDGMIGRSAHIRLLDSPKVMQMLITTNANLFN
eukprot:Phypoly_transcript_01067.p1 GENE.Phypoly_transcript_01067~~Phypoly_transcript_01067.p1  ORF type:complete len:1167 (+),score=163.07 Phypoly_transcript_01067:204-3704(+)